MPPPQVVPQPRQDLLAHAAASGEPRRVTTYTGTVWLAPPPRIGTTAGMRTVTTTGVEELGPAGTVRVFLPDSLPYVPGVPGEVAASASVLGGVDQSGAWLLHPPEAALVADPRDGARAWVALDLRGHGRLHAVGYTVVVTVPVDAVAP